ncbi:MAG: VWA domain-containing protein [Candidatus Lokiarchaeota archaeon]|nr:VWA domain-containing protein [Candidatus Lokiarchaeota archaeon]
MAEKIPENVVLCVDTSRSMIRTDYHPNRLSSSVDALKSLVKLRLETDPKSTFAIVSFLEKPTLILEFTNIINVIHDHLDSLRIGGKSPLAEALALSVKVAVRELRKIDAKTPKILLVSDGNYLQTDTDLFKIVKLSRSLNIKIDVFRIGETSDYKTMKKISELSGGRIFYVNSPESLVDAAHSFATDNVKDPGLDEGSLVRNPAILRKIAADPLRVQDLTEDQEQRIKQLRGEADYKKCSICFSETDPSSKGTFFLTGRYCPNCQSPFHIHCLAGWAASQNERNIKQSGTCRCPHCFYLLRIPSEVSQMRKLRTLSALSQKKTESKGPIAFQAMKKNTSDLEGDDLYSSCPVCNYIFELEQDVIECGNPDCGSMYHLECFSKLTNHQCKVCGSKLTLT